VLSIGKVGFSATPGSKTPEPIAMKLGVRNYVGDTTLTSEYGSDRAARGSRRMHEISLFDFILFLQRVSIACYAERCTSYSKSVRPSVCPSHAGTVTI